MHVHAIPCPVTSNITPLEIDLQVTCVYLILGMHAALSRVFAFFVLRQVFLIPMAEEAAQAMEAVPTTPVETQDGSEPPLTPANKLLSKGQS